MRLVHLCNTVFSNSVHGRRGVRRIVLMIAALGLTFSAAQAQERAERPLRPIAQDRGKILERDGKRMLWGGKDESWHFDISDFLLEPGRLHYGIGRERFSALIEPRFESAAQADEWLADTARVLVISIGAETKVYPLELLLRHEVVNDVVAGRPVFAAFCYLADLGACYDRTIAGRTYTFALSGYTYYDPHVWDGLDAFVMWDRETESLWWPPIGKAVSGLMKNTPMKVMDEQLWSQTTWSAVKTGHTNAVVLSRGQTLDPPQNWPRYTTAPSAADIVGDAPEEAIAPRWGENDGSTGNKE